MTAPGSSSSPAGRSGVGGALAHHARWRLAVVIGCIAVLVIGYTGLPRGEVGLPRIARRAVTMAVPRWHSTEPVNAVVYGTRQFDTLGETFLLVAAAVAVAMVGRSREERRDAAAEAAQARREQAEIDTGPGFPELGGPTGPEPSPAQEAEESEESGSPEHDQPPGWRGPDPHEGMTVVVRVATKILLPLLAMIALLVVAWGYAPGGGFPAAVALAGVALLVYASRGLGALGPFHNTDVLEAVEVVAALALLAVALGGFIDRGSLTANWLPLGVTGTIQGGGVLQAFSGLEVFEVTAGLLLVLFALLGMRHDWSEGEPQ